MHLRARMAKGKNIFEKERELRENYRGKEDMNIKHVSFESYLKETVAKSKLTPSNVLDFLNSTGGSYEF